MAGFRTTRRLRAKAPYDFGKSLILLVGGDPQIRSYQDGAYRQALQVDDTVLLLTARALGTVDNVQVAVELLAEDPAGPKTIDRTWRIANRIFNLDLDLNPFYSQVRDDAVLGGLVHELRGVKAPRTPTVHEALVESITEQQISLVAAHSMQARLIRRYGRSTEIDGERYFAFPSPAGLADASIEDLRACGLSGKKAEYIRDVSAAASRGDLDLAGMERTTDSQLLIEELCEIRGIGRWTAEMTALRGMGRHDLLPADDVGLRRALARFYAPGKRITADEARRIAEPWGKWRGLAAFYLIVAQRAGLAP
jgi:DNA-3-methyladenine glycosylase II